MVRAHIPSSPKSAHNLCSHYVEDPCKIQQSYQEWPKKQSNLLRGARNSLMTIQHVSKWGQTSRTESLNTLRRDAFAWSRSLKEVPDLGAFSSTNLAAWLMLRGHMISIQTYVLCLLGEPQWYGYDCCSRGTLLPVFALLSLKWHQNMDKSLVKSNHSYHYNIQAIHAGYPKK